jgi:hypothetical protein
MNYSHPKMPLILLSIRTVFGIWMPIHALIDSGADVTMIPHTLAKILGLPILSDSFIAEGIGGNTKVRKSRIQCRIKKKNKIYTIHPPVLILDKKHDGLPLILGRDTFFTNFQITFKHNEKRIMLKRVSTINAS